MYEGHPIHKFGNDIILLFFRTSKIRDICFVGNLIVNTSCKFHHDDTTVTSVINIMHGGVAVESIPRGTAFCYSSSVAKMTRC